MSAVEEIRAAIVKLTELKAESTPGPWELEPPGKYFDPRWDDTRIMHAANRPTDPNYDRYLFRDGSYAEDSGGLGLADAELIVTLHRTIDAQLHILTGTVTLYPSFVANGTEDQWLHAVERAGDLALARAINGGTQ